MRKQAKLGKMKAAKRSANLTAEERLEHFQRVAGGAHASSNSGGMASTSSSMNATGHGVPAGPVKKKKKGVPASWLAPPSGAAAASSTAGHEANGDDLFDDDDADGDAASPSLLSAQYRVPSQAQRMQAPPSASTDASLSSRPIGPPSGYTYGAGSTSAATAAAAWMQASRGSKRR